MKKFKNIAVWLTVLVILFTAAYLVYDKYGNMAIVQPPASDTGQPDQSGSNADNDSSSSNSSTDREERRHDQDSNSDSVQEQQGSGVGGQEQESAEDEIIMVPDFSLKDLDGNDISLSDYRGKIVIVNFWTTWCTYCVEEMPGFNTVDKELREAGDAVILAVNVQESYDTVSDYIAENDIDLKILMDEDGAVSTGKYGVYSYPNTFVVNKDGSLYAYVPGKLEIDSLRKIIDMARNNAPLN